MRIIGDISTQEIIQCGKVPEVGTETVINGKFVFDVPFGSVPVTNTSYFSPYIGSVVEAGFDNLLQAFNSYQNIEVNPLIDSSSLSGLDFTATLDNTGNYLGPSFPILDMACRYQAGSSVAPIGLVPNTTAILPLNSIDNSPGLIITDTIDISSTFPAGTVNFMLYWKLYRFSTSSEVRSNYGVTSGLNQAVEKKLIDIDPTDSGNFQVALSVDDGAFYTVSPGNLRSFTVPVPGNQVRIAFINLGTNKLYLGNYALLY